MNIKRYFYKKPLRLTVLQGYVKELQNGAVTLLSNLSIIQAVKFLPSHQSVARYLNLIPGSYSVVGLMYSNGKSKYMNTMEISRDNQSLGVLRFIKTSETVILN